MVQPPSLNTQNTDGVMSTTLQHNAQSTIQLAILILIISPHYEVSIGYYIYCLYYKDKEPSSGVPSANGIFTEQQQN